MINIALFGPPGAGKGTQSEYLIKKYNLFYISTGDLLRKEISEGSDLGNQAKSIIEQGGLVSDEIIVQIIEKTIKNNPDSRGFLFDGFPRTYVQGYILDGLMIKLNTSLNCLINLKVDDEISVERLLLRGKVSGRSDDNEIVIRKRLEEYNQKTIPVLNYYREKGICYDVDGLQDINGVTKSIAKIVDAELDKNLFNIVLTGYPGSGRGTHGRALARDFGLEYVSTGVMLREEYQSQSEIGKKIGHLYEKGELVPDEIVIQLIEKKIESSKGVKGFLFKGYPRTLVQSYILDGLLRKHGSSISKVVDMNVPILELIQRLDKRGKSPKGRAYDTETWRIVQRLQEHEQKTLPVLERYRQSRQVHVIDGTGERLEIYNRILDVVKGEDE